MAKKWEYCRTSINSNNGGYSYLERLYDFTGETIIEILNKFGDLGWELVVADGNIYLFKRELDRE